MGLVKKFKHMEQFVLKNQRNIKMFSFWERVVEIILIILSIGLILLGLCLILGMFGVIEFTVTPSDDKYVPIIIPNFIPILT